MKLIHASIPADDPNKVASVLAEMLDGEALPFPPAGPAARTAYSGDGKISLEIVPRGHLIHRGQEQGGWRPVENPQRLSEVHLAIGVDKPAAEIVAIAEKAGWPARICSRGNGFFELVEVWVEGVFMLEMLDPEQAAHFERVVTVENLKRYLAAA
jgi:hypothetical protein